jgi:hypothetical protein
VRSTALLSGLDRVRYAELLDVQRSILEGAVVAADGTVVDQTGDGVLAAFASAGDALSAAAAAQRTFGTNDTRELLSVRMGIDSGDVLLREESYIGTAVHRGARICALAGGGSVLLSATSRELVGTHPPEAVELRDLGEVRLAGFAEPVQLFQAVLTDVPASAKLPSLPRGRNVHLFDRERELAILDQHIRAALGGTGGVVAIEGAAGIGKTSLVETARASAGGMTSLAARATELESGYPFGVVRLLLEPAVRAAGEAAFAGAAGGARPLFDGASTGPVGDGFAILHSLYWLTANLSERGPLLLTVDDIQWCDALSLRYLAYLAPRIGDLPILLLVARRSGESSVAEEALHVVVSDPQTTVIRPGGLSARAVAELLRRVLAQTPDPAFVEACREATVSNPLLVRELAGALATAAVPPTAEGVASIPELGPAAVSRFVLRRLGRLTASARRLAESVAVLGDGCALAASRATAPAGSTTVPTRHFSIDSPRSATSRRPVAPGWAP